MPIEVERLVDLYDGGSLSRRELVQGIFALGVAPRVTQGRASRSQSAALSGSDRQSRDNLRLAADQDSQSTKRLRFRGRGQSH